MLLKIKEFKDSPQNSNMNSLSHSLLNKLNKQLLVLLHYDIYPTKLYLHKFKWKTILIEIKTLINFILKAILFIKIYALDSLSIKIVIKKKRIRRKYYNELGRSIIPGIPAPEVT